jgi:DUF4097 and DUF4098 domain-containing protein YvlB
MEPTMKNLSVRAMSAIVLLACTSSAYAQERPQVVNVPLSRPGEPIELRIDLATARIEVIGEDREDARFEVSVAGGQRKIITPSGAQSIKGGSYAFEIDEDDNEISFDSDWRAEKVTVLARVPKRASVSLSTVNDGEIVVSDIVGNLELSNVNGPVTARNISGSVIAASINAAIDVTFAKIDDVNASSFETINGDIEVGIPAGAGAQLHLDSGQGQITSDFEVEVVPTEGMVTHDEDGDGVAIRIENVIVVKINGGGPVLRLKSLHGDMHIREAQ